VEKDDRYEPLDFEGLAKKLNLPKTWIEDQTRSRCADPIPHRKYKRYVRFIWLNPDLQEWLSRHDVTGTKRPEGTNRPARLKRQKKLSVEDACQE
jgi:hypothetical protein